MSKETLDDLKYELELKNAEIDELTMDLQNKIEEINKLKLYSTKLKYEKKNLEDKEVSFQVKTGKDDRVFGSISPKQVKDELDKKGINLDKKQIEFDHTICSLGYHDVIINLYKEVFVKIRIKLEK